MKKILGTFVLGVALLAPTQIVAVASEYEETLEMNYLVMERMQSTGMRMSEVMMKLMKNRSRMSKARMAKLMNYIGNIDILLQRINDGLEE